MTFHVVYDDSDMSEPAASKLDDRQEESKTRSTLVASCVRLSASSGMTVLNYAYSHESLQGMYTCVIMSGR